MTGFGKARRGEAGLSYALMVGLVAMVAIAALAFSGTTVRRLFANVSNRMENVTVGGGGASSGASGGSGGSGTCVQAVVPYVYSGAPQPYEVPANCTQFEVRLWGAGGGGASSNGGHAGGGGGYARAIVTGVAAGADYDVLVGQGGQRATVLSSSAYWDAGGGGRSALRVNGQITEILVAGAGGGAGDGNGGAAGSGAAGSSGENGAKGGGTTGGLGASGASTVDGVNGTGGAGNTSNGTCDANLCAGGLRYGGKGSNAALGNDSAPGAWPNGGAGIHRDGYYAGGGGGDGWYGGGAASGPANGGGGGGGIGFAAATGLGGAVLTGGSGATGAAGTVPTGVTKPAGTGNGGSGWAVGGNGFAVICAPSCP